MGGCRGVKALSLPLMSPWGAKTPFNVKLVIYHPLEVRRTMYVAPSDLQDIL